MNMRWKDLNYYYAWEIPFFYYERMKIAGNTKETKAVIWINTQNYEVIGAGINIGETKE